MFGIFKKVKEQKQIKVLENQARNSIAYQKREELYREARTILKEFLVGRAKTYEKYTKPHIKIGDRVILNKYEIDYKNLNGWDSGVNAILSSLTNIGSPIYAKITDITVSFSLTNERIDAFIANYFDAELRTMIDRAGYSDGLQAKFIEFVKTKEDSRYYGIFQRDTGLYIEAAFELEFIDPSNVKCGDSFKPSWGLNIGSFLKDDSPGGIKTKELWMEEISIRFALETINKRKSELEEQLKQLHLKY